MVKTNYKEEKNLETNSNKSYLNFKDKNGKTPLFYAYENDNINLFKRII